METTEVYFAILAILIIDLLIVSLLTKEYEREKANVLLKDTIPVIRKRFIIIGGIVMGVFNLVSPFILIPTFVVFGIIGGITVTLILLIIFSEWLSKLKKYFV